MIDAKEAKEMTHTAREKIKSRHKRQFEELLPALSDAVKKAAEDGKNELVLQEFLDSTDCLFTFHLEDYVELKRYGYTIATCGGKTLLWW